MFLPVRPSQPDIERFVRNSEKQPLSYEPVGSAAGPGARYGFAYGTLTNHAEGGEELFELFMEPATGQVMYRIKAISGPRAALARVGYPIVRVLQARSVAIRPRHWAGDSACQVRR